MWIYIDDNISKSFVIAGQLPHSTGGKNEENILSKELGFWEWERSIHGMT